MSSPTAHPATAAVPASAAMMTQTCFEGDTEGKAAHFACHSKLPFVSDGGAEEVCDAQVVPDETLRLYNCDGVDTSFAERIYVRVDGP